MILNVESVDTSSVENSEESKVKNQPLFDKNDGMGSVGKLVTYKKGGYTKPHTHIGAHACYVTKGEGLVTIDKVGHYVKEGTFIIIPGNTCHSVKNMSDSEFAVLVISNGADEYEQYKNNLYEKARKAD